MVTPYIVFDKQCEEAVNFYEKVFLGKNREIMRYNDYVLDTGRDLPADISHYVLHDKMELFDTEFAFANEFSEVLINGNTIYLTVNPNRVNCCRIYNSSKRAVHIFQLLYILQQLQQVVTIKILAEMIAEKAHISCCM